MMALVPFQSRRSGFLGANEPETSSITVPSAKSSPAVLTVECFALERELALSRPVFLKALSFGVPGEQIKALVFGKNGKRPDRVEPSHTYPQVILRRKVTKNT